MKTLLTLLILLINTAHADPRITLMANAWNNGDTLGVQEGWDHDAVSTQVRLALLAEHGGKLTILNTKEVTPKVYALDVILDDKHETWLMIECEDSIKWCFWGHRTIATLGSAEGGQLIDVITSTIGSGLGFAELNPLGYGVLPIKAAGLLYSHQQDYIGCVQNRTLLDSLGMASGVANLITLVSSISGPAIPIAIMAIGTAARWDDAKENAMYECAQYSLKEPL